MIFYNESINNRPTPKEVHEAIRANNAKTDINGKYLDISSLKEGQVLKGFIIDLRFNQVKLMIEPGNQLLLAELSDEVPLSIGQNAEFIVTKDSSNQFILKHKPDETNPVIQQTIEKALTASGLPMSDKNIAIVEELLNQHMPIDKATLQVLHKYSTMHRDTTPSTLVSMYKHEIPINSENVSQFESYQQGTHELLHVIQRITHNISILLEYPETSSSDNAFTDFIEFPRSLISILKSHTDTTVTVDAPSISTVLSPIQRKNLVENLEPFQPLIAEIDFAENVLNESVLNESAINENVPSESALAGSVLNDIQNGTASLTQVLNVFENVILQNPEKLQEFEYMNTLINSPEFPRIIREAFLSRWTIPIKDLSKKNIVRDLYRNLEEDMESLDKLDITSTKAVESLILKEPIKNVQDNLEFMRELNEVMQYIQLPIQLKDQDIHVDLYVLNKKRPHSDNNESLNIFIQLEMEHLGSISIKMVMSERNIKAGFQLDDSKAGEIIEKHLPQLTKTLAKKGYQFNGYIEPAKEKPNIFHELLSQGPHNKESLRYSFDIRA